MVKPAEPKLGNVNTKPIGNSNYGIIGNRLPNATRSVVGSYAPSTIAGNEPPQVEPPQVQPDIVDPPAVGGHTPSSGSGRVVGSTFDLSLPKLKGGKNQPPAVLKGVLEPGQTEQEQATIDYAQERIRQGDIMTGLAFLQAGKVSQKAHEDMAYLAANNSLAVSQMVNEEFPKFKAASEKLQAELEDIRSLRVNPYQYLQDAGRGGRAGAALATAVSQMAAGAGNVNSARKALDNAIKRDIEAQISNIDYAFLGVEAAQAGINQQVMLLEEEILFRDKALAYAWESANALINSALQGAQNEATYIGLQVLRDHAAIQSATAAAAARAKMGSIYIEWPLFSARNVTQANEFAGQGLELLQKAFKTGAASAPAQAVPEKAPLRFSDPGLQAQYEQLEQQEALQSSTTQPQTATGGEPAAQPSVQSRRPSGSGGKKKSNVSVEIGEVLVGEEAIAASETGEDGVPSSIARPELEPPQRINEKQFLKNALRDIEPGLAKELMRVGGYGRRVASVLNDPGVNIPRWEDSIEALRNNPATYFNDRTKMVGHPTDARLIAKLDYEENVNSLEGEDLANLIYRTSHPEVYEGNTTFVDKTGSFERTTIKNGTFGDLKLTQGSPARYNLAELNKIKTRVTDASGKIQTFRKAADAVGKTTLGSFLGFRWDNEEGMEFAAFDESAQAHAAELEEALTAMGVDWIKGKDPSGRLSDQDVKLAMRIVAASKEKRSLQLADFIGTWLSKDNMSSVRKGLITFYKIMAENKEQELLNSLDDDIVLTYPAYLDRQETLRKNREFYKVRKAESEKL